jgi:hypothetical protein
MFLLSKGGLDAEYPGEGSPWLHPLLHRAGLQKISGGKFDIFVLPWFRHHQGYFRFCLLS